MDTIDVVVIDHNENIAEKLKSILNGHSEYKMMVHEYFYNYHSFIQEIDKVQADVFLVSAYLPDLMGINLIEKIKKQHLFAKTILTIEKTTANLPHTADASLWKPFTLKRFFETVESVTTNEQKVRPHYIQRGKIDGMVCTLKETKEHILLSVKGNEKVEYKVGMIKFRNKGEGFRIRFKENGEFYLYSKNQDTELKKQATEMKDFLEKQRIKILFSIQNKE